MNDLELAEEIEQHKLHLGGYLTESQWDQIIAALRRGPEPEVCPRCKGSGEAKGMTSGHGPDDYEIDIPCPDCNGTGERPPSGEMVMVPREPTHHQIQLIFNTLMGELPEVKPDGWWGTSDQVAEAKKFYRIGFVLFCVFIATVFLSCAAGVGLVQFLNDEPQRVGKP